MFNNREELLAYCMDDVILLRQACCAFEICFLKLVEMDPFGLANNIAHLQQGVQHHVFETGFCSHYH